MHSVNCGQKKKKQKRKGKKNDNAAQALAGEMFSGGSLSRSAFVKAASPERDEEGNIQEHQAMGNIHFHTKCDPLLFKSNQCDRSVSQLE